MAAPMRSGCVTLGHLIDLVKCPTRREILAVLSRGPISVTALAKHTGIDITHVSRYLAMFAAAQLVTSRRVGRCRIYSLGIQAATRGLAGGGTAVILHASDGEALQIEFSERTMGVIGRPIDGEASPDGASTAMVR